MNQQLAAQQSVTDVPLRGSTEFPSYHLPMRRAKTVTSRRGPDAQISVPSQLRGTHLNEAEGTGIIAIGMALGSPTQEPTSNPVSAPWQPHHTTLTTTITGGVTNDADAATREGGLARTKSRKWGIFGRSKSKRGKDTDTIPASQGSVLPSPRTGLVRAASSAAAFRRTPSTRVLQRSLEPASIGSVVNSAADRPIAGMNMLSVPPGLQTKPQQLASGGQASDGLMLQLDIPDLTLDRYSVMFANVLEKRGSSSLLARRQAAQTRLRELKQSDPLTEATTNDDKRASWLPIQVPETLDVSRRKETHHLERLPATTYQPPPSRLRANTSPAMLPSPSREGFGELYGAQPQRPHITRLASTKQKSPDAIPEPLAPIEAQQLRSRFRKPTQDVAPAERPHAIAEMKPGDVPVIELFPPRTDSHKNNASSEVWLPSNVHVAKDTQVLSRVDERFGTLVNRHDLPHRTSLSLSLSSVSEDEPEETADKDILSNPVEISIARQISVSRQQSRMLGPLQMHPPKARQLASNPKTSTPRLMNPTNGQGRHLRHAVSLREIAQPRMA